MNYANAPFKMKRNTAAIKVYSSAHPIHENPIPLLIIKRENQDELANYCCSNTSVFHSLLFAGSIPDTVAEPQLQVSTIFLESIE